MSYGTHLDRPKYCILGTEPLTGTSEVTAATLWAEKLRQRLYFEGANGTIRSSLRPYEVNWLTAQGPRPVQVVVVE